MGNRSFFVLRKMGAVVNEKVRTKGEYQVAGGSRNQIPQQIQATPLLT
jgi:hypothetical protein